MKGESQFDLQPGEAIESLADNVTRKEPALAVAQVPTRASLERCVDLLARDLAAPGVHDLLNDRVGWRRVIWRAVDGSENHRAILAGLEPPFASRARELIARAEYLRIRTARTPSRGRRAAVLSDTPSAEELDAALAGFDDTMPLPWCAHEGICWPGDDVEVHASSTVHPNGAQPNSEGRT
jgi:hypothetical protein